LIVEIKFFGGKGRVIVKDGFEIYSKGSAGGLEDCRVKDGSEEVRPVENRIFGRVFGPLSEIWGVFDGRVKK
jgi:hypothetical protein